MPANQYPLYIAWRIDLTGINNLDQLMSRNRTRRIQKALTILAGSTYKFTIEMVDQIYLDRFMPLYQQHIGAKEYGTIFDVRGKITQGLNSGKSYESISLWEDSTFVGGQIYSVKEDALSVAYRIFPYKLKVKLPISCSYIAEQYLLDRALALKKQLILHGKDQNLYGVHSAIGLAEYKLNVGCAPHVSSVANNSFHNIHELHYKKDTLVFIGDKPQQRITEGVLFTVSEPQSATTQYGNLLRQSTVQITLQKAPH